MSGQDNMQQAKTSVVSLVRDGRDIILNGYAPLPIKPRSKIPAVAKWQKLKPTMASMDKWLAKASSKHGVGILCEHTPVIDVDIYDEDIANLFEERLREFLADREGILLVKVGLYPKRSFIFRTDSPFTKSKSPVYEDELTGDDHHVEVLGKGQQTVVSGIHPDTEEPYVFMGTRNIANTKVGDLVHLSADDLPEIYGILSDIADPMWSIKQAGSESSSADYSDEEEFANLSTTTEHTLVECIELYEKLDESYTDTHDGWCQTGMALWHQFDGSIDAREAWIDWSKSLDSYDGMSSKELNNKWRSFDWKTSKGAPKTIRTILRVVNDGMTEESPTAVSHLDHFLENMVYVQGGAVVDLSRSTIEVQDNTRNNDLNNAKRGYPEATFKAAASDGKASKKTHILEKWILHPCKIK